MNTSFPVIPTGYRNNSILSGGLSTKLRSHIGVIQTVKRPVSKPTEKVDDMQESIEEILQQLKVCDADDLVGVVSSHTILPKETGVSASDEEISILRRPDIILCEIKLYDGDYRLKIVFGNLKKSRLRNLARKMAKPKKHIFTTYVVFSTGGSKEKLRSKIAYNIRTIIAEIDALSMTEEADKEREMRRSAKKNRRWATAKNFQPQFA